MSRRGHKTGTICTYFKTWLLKTDGKGCVEISDPIPFDSQGTDTKASMTEVRQCKHWQLIEHEACFNPDHSEAPHAGKQRRVNIE